MSIRWIAVLRRVWQLDRGIRRGRRRLAAALENAGEAMAQRLPLELPDPASELLALATENRGLLVALSDAKARSLNEDRRDYSAVSSWARPMVIARGLSARAVLRNRIARARRDLRARCQRLAAHGFEDKIDPLCDSVPAELARDVVALRTGLEDRERERAQILAPFGGVALPRACHWVARELALFIRFTVRELKNRFLPRLPVLVGLAVGWWVAHTFTDSRTPGLLRLLGFGRTSKHYVPSATFKAMSLWLPLLSSVVCAYLADRVGALIRHRYGSVSEAAPVAARGTSESGAGAAPSSAEHRAVPDRAEQSR